MSNNTGEVIDYKLLKRVLVLGSSGYIGKHLVTHLSDQGFIVFGFDQIPNEKNNQTLANFYLGDIENLVHLKKAILDSNPEVIIDLAANAEVGDGMTIEDYKMNSVSPMMIARIANEIKENTIKKIIFTSLITV